MLDEQQVCGNDWRPDIKFSLNRQSAVLSLISGFLLILLCEKPVNADTSHDVYTFTSNTGTILYVVAGVGLPLVTDGSLGVPHALRSADSLITSGLFAEGLKALVQEKRPNSSAHDSFPSGHATAVFSVATMQSQFHPRQAPLWFAAATLIGVSRFGLHAHTVGDVLAGAALGFGTARLELSSRRGLLLAPFVPPSGRGIGLNISKSF